MTYGMASVASTIQVPKRNAPNLYSSTNLHEQ